MREKETKVIHNHELANYLLSRGYQLVHIKPHKDHPNISVFVFSIAEGLLEAIDSFGDHRETTFLNNLIK